MVMDVTLNTDSVQDRSRRRRANGSSDNAAAVMPVPVLMLGSASPISVLPPWWSRNRDIELRKYWKTEGLLASSIYTMQAIVSSTGFTIEGKPRLVTRARPAIDDAEYGAGFSVLLKKSCEDWLTQDNGFFWELEGPGNISSPLTEPVTRINHMDAGRCWRSGDPEHPVWYYSEVDFQWHKIHWTRVAFASPNPSSIELARGIGFCAVSRVEALSTVIKAIVKYKQEKTGGRHSRGILYGNVPPDAVKRAFEAAGEVADNAELVHYSPYPYVGSPMAGEVNLGLLELSSLPDGFEWESELTLYMYCIALALGVDARELWPATASGATKADAEVQHRKAMRKGVGDFLATAESMVNARVLPEGVTHTFKPKDNEEDQEQATIEKTRVETVEKLIGAGIVTVKGAALYLVNSGVLPEEYMDNEELSDAAKDPEEEAAAQEAAPESGDEPIVADETPDETPASPTAEPTVEDEGDVTKQATENEPVIVDPAKAGPAASEADLPGPAVTQTTIQREMALWAKTPELRDYVVPLENVGDYEKLPTVEEQPAKRRRKNLWAWLTGIKQGYIPDASRETLLGVRVDIYYDIAEMLARQLATGEITLIEWETEMREAIKGMETSAAAIGRGSWEAMGFSEWGRVGQEARKQYSYLHSWALELQEKIQSGQPISEMAISMRARMYGNSATATYNRMLQIDKGIDPSIMPAQPGDGTTQCYTNCQCSWQFVPVNAGRGDYDAYWRLGAADHCDTCIARAAQWAPLQIRGGNVSPGQVNGGLFR